MPKKWYTSRTIYAAGIAFVAAILQQAFGWVITPGLETAIFAVILIVLRAVTKQPVEW